MILFFSEETFDFTQHREALRVSVLPGQVQAHMAGQQIELAQSILLYTFFFTSVPVTPIPVQTFSSSVDQTSVTVKYIASSGVLIMWCRCHTTGSRAAVNQVCWPSISRSSQIRPSHPTVLATNHALLVPRMQMTATGTLTVTMMNLVLGEHSWHQRGEDAPENL
ncbi:hypothetical protein BaRGS_00039735 [Batillaria attramentaria]|uniref:Uncharacterized protein n=1 Tax=Batillaria attramentaria TaxID=370345 RepID=A0ABD0J300_9CAEN